MPPSPARVTAALLGVVALGYAGYRLFLKDDKPRVIVDPLAHSRTACGDADPAKGDKLYACLDLAYDLMGRIDVPVDDDAARALMKRACDRAFQPACDALLQFEATKLDFLERRCASAAAYKDSVASCLAAGARRENGTGVKVDRKAAIEHYDTACLAGNAEGCTSRDRLKSR
jgi:hypothetical protein